MRSRRSAAATLVLGLALVFAFAGPAQASCAGPPSDSPAAFTGTVVEVEKDGRVAYVALDDGSTAVVHGSPGLGNDTVTSVDRRFAAGARYEFHPFNDTSPFQDNACSATRQLAGPTPGPVEPSEDRLPGWLPVDEQNGPIGYGAVGVMLVVAIALLAVPTVLVAHRLQVVRLRVTDAHEVCPSTWARALVRRLSRTANETASDRTPSSPVTTTSPS